MKRAFFLFLSAILISSCSSVHYTKENPSQIKGLDFSKGKWLFGTIDPSTSIKGKWLDKNLKPDADINDELTQIALKDFSEHLNDRLNYVSDTETKTLLMADKIPLNPSKSNLSDLKKGTGFDYFINIKYINARNDLKDFKLIEHNYYIKQMTFGIVTLEVYDLNLGKIIYSQRVRGAIDESHSGLSFNLNRKIILGCYEKIMSEIKQNSI